jgi:hypothetical protein
MGWDDLIHPSLGFLMNSIRRAHRAKRGKKDSLFYSLGEEEESNGDGNGSKGRGKQGCLLSWRALGGFGFHLFVVFMLA